MPVYICEGCGTSYPESSTPPAKCRVCNEERAHVPGGVQQWTRLEDMQTRYRNVWKQLEENIFEISTHPRFSIGQRALFIRTPAGNLLWDCISFLDDTTVSLLNALGGVHAIAISHPHYYTTCQDWAAAFGCPVYLHEDDREWLMRPSAAVNFWSGDELRLNPHVRLIRLGGHYRGGCVALLPDAASGRGALLTGDIIQVAADRQRVSFMWSYPNMLPLSEKTVRRMADVTQSLPFDRLYGALPGYNILTGARDTIRRCADRYIDLLNDRTGHEGPAD